MAVGSRMKRLVWKRRELKTMGEVMEVVTKIKTKKEALAFMKLYRDSSPYAASNLGYFAGYYSTTEAKRIWDLFECAHPIFGTHLPTGEEAFEAGKKIGRRTRTKEIHVQMLGEIEKAKGGH